MTGRYVEVSDTRLWIEERGDGFPLVVLHGGPGLDHHEFGDYLDPLTDEVRLVFVDQRSQGMSDIAPAYTLTVAHMAEDVVHVGRHLREPYAVLGHSFGAFVALRHALDFPGMAAGTIVSSGVPSARYLRFVERNLRAFEPEHLRERVAASWEREATVESQGDVEDVLRDQLPFHFADPLDPRIEEYARRSAGGRYSADVVRHFALQGYGSVELEERLGEIATPMLVIAGRHDRSCPVEASEAIARAAPNARLVVLERSAHMGFVEEPDTYLGAVRSFVRRLAR